MSFASIHSIVAAEFHSLYTWRMNSQWIKSPIVSSPAPLLMDTQHGFSVREAMPSAEKCFCLLLFFLVLPIFSPCLMLWKSLSKIYWATLMKLGVLVLLLIREERTQAVGLWWMIVRVLSCDPSENNCLQVVWWVDGKFLQLVFCIYCYTHMFCTPLCSSLTCTDL